MTSLLAFFAQIDWSDVAQAALDTLTMLAWSLGWTVLLGLPLGIVLYLTGEPRLLYAPRLYRLLSLCVNVLRSLPFIILLIVMIPLTTLLSGTSLGVEGTIPPLVAGCAPFFARLVETALREVEHGLVEASWSMGGSTWQLIWHTLLPESRAGLIAAVTVTAILLVDYTSMAGVIGAGGLGNLAYLEGFQRNHGDVTLVATVTILIIVFIIQFCGDVITSLLDKR